MSSQIMLSFILFSAISAITPGPNNIMLLSSGINFGIKKSIPTMIGVVIGFFIVNLAMGIFLYRIIDSSPTTYLIIQIASILYMFYLIYLIVNTTSISDKDTKVKKPIGFFKMVLLQWLNPKGISMSVITMSLYIGVYLSNHLVAVIMLSFIHMLTGVFAAYVWLTLGANIRKLFKNTLYLKIFNYSMAILIIVSIIPAVQQIISKIL